MLESLIYLDLDASLSFLFLRTVSGNDPLSFSEIGSDGLRIRETLDSVEIGALESTNLDRDGLKGSSFNRVDREFVVWVNSSVTSGNLFREIEQVENSVLRR